MSKFTASEVLELIESDETTHQYRYWRDKTWHDGEGSIVEDGWSEIGGQRVLVDGEWIEVEQVAAGGGMDQGSDAFVVFRFGTQLFKKDGYYASHYGYDWDGDFYEVEAYDKVVVDYRKV